MTPLEQSETIDQSNKIKVIHQETSSPRLTKMNPDHDPEILALELIYLTLFDLPPIQEEYITSCYIDLALKEIPTTKESDLVKTEVYNMSNVKKCYDRQEQLIKEYRRRFEFFDSLRD